MRITLLDVHLNWLNWFHFLILNGGLLVILIDHMIFLSPFLDVTRISMSTVLFLAQLGCRILCLKNVFLWPMIYMVFNLELIDIFWMQVLVKQISCMPQIFCVSFSCNSMPCSGCSVLHGVNSNYQNKNFSLLLQLCCFYCTDVALMRFMLHLCCISVALLLLVCHSFYTCVIFVTFLLIMLHFCCTCLALHSYCKIDSLIILWSLHNSSKLCVQHFFSWIF